VLSEVDSVYSGGSFPFLHGGRVFLITLRGAGVALRVNEIGIACKGNRLLQRGPSYIGRSMVAVDQDVNHKKLSIYGYIPRTMLRIGVSRARHVIDKETKKIRQQMRSKEGDKRE
jgi:hypothetical protein